MEQRLSLITLGYSGMFVDPDGHAWEVAHNPEWTVTDDGATLLDG